MTSPRAIASELAQKYGRAYISNPKDIRYNPQTKELIISFEGKRFGVMTKAEEVATSFENFVEQLFCECVSEEETIKRDSLSIKLSSAFGNMPIALISQEGTRVYITPKTGSIGTTPIKSVLTGFKKSLKYAHA